MAVSYVEQMAIQGSRMYSCGGKRRGEVGRKAEGESAELLREKNMPPVSKENYRKSHFEAEVNGRNYR